MQIVMISIDPERDTEEKLAEYVPYFNDEFIGVTGNKHLMRVSLQSSMSLITKCL